MRNRQAVRKFTFPLPPSANKIWRNNGAGVTYATRVARDFKDEVGWMLRSARVEPVSCEVKVTLTIYYSDKRRDLDNFIKITLDAMKRHVYYDDAQVAELHVYRRRVPVEECRCEVEIEFLPS